MISTTLQPGCEVVSDVPEFPRSVWEAQAAHVPQKGTPDSIRHLRNADAEVLLSYDDNGYLRGILKYFDKDVPKSDRHGDYLVAHAGEVLIIVHPDHQKRGLGTKLLREAMGLWNIDLAKQRYTKSGVAFVAKFQQNGAAASRCDEPRSFPSLRAR